MFEALIQIHNTNIKRKYEIKITGAWLYGSWTNKTYDINIKYQCKIQIQMSEALIQMKIQNTNTNVLGLSVWLRV